MKPDLKTGADLLTDVLLNANFPEKAIAREKEVQKAGIKLEEEQLTIVARNILRQALFTDHPYALRSNGSTESVQRLTQKDLVEFRDKYLVAKNVRERERGRSEAIVRASAWQDEAGVACFDRRATVVADQQDRERRKQ